MPLTKNETSPPRVRTDPALWLYAASILLSAFLLFQIQPILAKLILPWFGGAAAVWMVSLAFYQVAYLLRNLYAHLLVRYTTVRVSARAHAILLLASLLLLPILPGTRWQPQPSDDPVRSILVLLAVTVGLPFLLLSATSPLLQAWRTAGGDGTQPYRLYALSNAGSLLALLSYPVIAEPFIATHRQGVIWSIAYGVFAVLCSLLAFRQTAPQPTASRQTAKPAWTLQFLWLFLAACPSALLLAVTQHVSQNIAAIPLLWIVPLSLYLASLILCFDGDRWYRRGLFLPLLPVALAAMAYQLLPQFDGSSAQFQIPLYFIGLFVCCMVCHGEMTALKPSPERLTSFYLMVSTGGALGGLFVALLAPRVFHEFYELPIALGACSIATLIVLLREPASSGRRLGTSTQLAAVGSMALIVALLIYVGGRQGRQAILTARNFYGVLRVAIMPRSGPRPSVTQLRHGTIVHGEEIVDEARSDTPTTYYSPQSGVGIALLFARQHGNLRVGVIGLGVGTIARYGQKGDRYAFYEINPLVSGMAENIFDFLKRSEAQVDIIPGDGRLSLERQPPQEEYDVLVVDAFSGDAIPMHLLTREAVELYFRHLKPNGVLALHVTNRNLNLPPVVAAVAQSTGARAVRVSSAAVEQDAVYAADWMLVDRTATPNPTVTGLVQSTVILPASTSARIEEPTHGDVWTDDYSNLLRIFK